MRLSNESESPLFPGLVGDEPGRKTQRVTGKFARAREDADRGRGETDSIAYCFLAITVYPPVGFPSTVCVIR